MSPCGSLRKHIVWGSSTKSKSSWPCGQKSINPINYALRVTAEGGIIYKIYKISRRRRRAGVSWVYGTRYKSKLLALRAEIYKSCKLYASRLLHQPKSECCRNRRISNEKPSDIRQIQSSPIDIYWIEATDNRKLDSVLIFIVSIIYDFLSILNRKIKIRKVVRLEKK